MLKTIRLVITKYSIKSKKKQLLNSLSYKKRINILKIEIQPSTDPCSFSAATLIWSSFSSADVSSFSSAEISSFSSAEVSSFSSAEVSSFSSAKNFSSKKTAIFLRTLLATLIKASA